MIFAGQVRAARALFGVDQRALAERLGLSPPTIQPMAASDGLIHGNVDQLMQAAGALSASGIQLIDDGAPSKGVRPSSPA
jgi:transcriptional regulator with XRE-family HTH domain